MTSLELGLWSFPVLLALIFLRLPIGLAMLLVGFAGTWLVTGSSLPILAQLKSLTYDTFSSYSLSIVPLFLLMGQFATRGGLSQALFKAAETWLGHRRGGVAMAAVGACAGFGAICGSSLATAATMSRVALPELRRYGYSGGFSTATLAAGGTLGILIPPSVIMVIYGSMTETSIGALFVAGIVPGLIGVLFYAAAVRFTVWRDPEAGPAGPKLPLRERLQAVREVWIVLGLFVLIIGGIYLGVFTPTEAAGMGAAGAFLIALFKRTLTPASFARVLVETVQTSAMLMCVLVGALIFSNFVNVAGVPSKVVALIDWFGLPPIGVILLIIVFYLILGCVFDSLAMILLTVPIFFPLVTGLGYDPVWFGILIVVAVEISLITPPIGMNIFIIRTVLSDLPVTTIYRGVVPFILADFLRLALIVALPALILFLPAQMGN